MNTTKIFKNKNHDINEEIIPEKLSYFNDFLKYIKYCRKHWKIEVADSLYNDIKRILVVSIKKDSNNIILKKYYANECMEGLEEITKPEYKKYEDITLSFNNREERDTHFDYFANILIKELGDKLSKNSYSKDRVNCFCYSWLLRENKNILSYINRKAAMKIRICEC